MENKKILKWTLIGFVFSILGTFVFHQLYDWLGNNEIVGLFAPVSESVWEHGKIILFPFLLFAILEYFILKPKDTPNYIATKLLSGIMGVITMIVLFYTYTGVTGNHNLIADVIIGFIGVLVSWQASYKFLKEDKQFKCKHFINVMGIAFIILYFIFTYLPPNFGMFIEH